MWLRRYIVFVCLLVSSCFCIFGCSESQEEPVKEVKVDDDIVADAILPSDITTFDFKLFGELIRREGIGKNIFMSPISIAIALAMTCNGAQGETQKAMAEVLELTGIDLETVNQTNALLIKDLGNPDPKVQLDIANSLWVREGVKFKPDFIQRNEDFYGAKVTNLDFDDPGAPDIINNWVSEKTHGNIDKIIDKIDDLSILFLINALYFKGTWTVEFDREKTYEGTFIRIDGSKKNIQMMNSKSDYMYYWDEKFEAISLPYGNGRVSMYIFLPNRDSSLREFYGSLNERNWRLWMSRFIETEVDIRLPKFSLEYEATLNDALIALGMGVAFAPGADFRGMSEDSPWIGEVKHKSFVEVNEEGTEAAAATVVEMKLGGPWGMFVDRPFFCAIRDNKTGKILFMGSIVDP